mgnify:FL=1
MPKELKDTLGKHVSCALRAMVWQLNGNFRAAGLDITADQFRVLAVIWHHSGLTQQELSCMLMQEKTSVSRLLTGLERRGFIRREPDPGDRRLRRIHLTEQGQVLRQQLERVVLDSLDACQQGIPEEDLETCKRVLKHVFMNIRGDSQDCCPAWPRNEETE